MNTATQPQTPATLQIDFVSDIACPWCAIGLASLEQAIANVGADVKTELRFQPFELNPKMGPEGQDIGEHLAQKYGSSPEQQQAIRNNIRERGASVGFEFNKEGRGRAWNTFNGHRLLFWAEQEGGADKQHALKKALLVAYHGKGQSPADDAVLLQAVRDVGLDEARAKEVLASGEYTDDVREREQMYLQAGINSVPAIIFNNRHLISGGQPVEVFERAIREIAASESTA